MPLPSPERCRSFHSSRCVSFCVAAAVSFIAYQQRDLSTESRLANILVGYHGQPHWNRDGLVPSIGTNSDGTEHDKECSHSWAASGTHFVSLRSRLEFWNFCCVQMSMTSQSPVVAFHSPSLEVLRLQVSPPLFSLGSPSLKHSNYALITCRALIYSRLVSFRRRHHVSGATWVTLSVSRRWYFVGTDPTAYGTHSIMNTSMGERKGVLRSRRSRLTPLNRFSGCKPPLDWNLSAFSSFVLRCITLPPPASRTLGLTGWRTTSLTCADLRLFCSNILKFRKHLDGHHFLSPCAAFCSLSGPAFHDSSRTPF